MGDFNFPTINWDEGIAQGNAENNIAQLFVDKVRDCFWSQQVDQFTRKRGQNRPSLLDLIIVNENNMIDNLLYNSPLGLSDHCLLSFQYSCYIDYPTSKRKRYFMDKMDVTKLRKELNINWNQTLNTKGEDTDTNTMWNNFEEKISEVQDSCIPHKMFDTNRKNWQLPVNQDVREIIRKKHRLWTRYIETRDQEKHQAYKKIRNKLRNITRKNKVQKERDIAADIKGNPKRFWKYVNSKTKTKTTIPDLEVTSEENTIKITTDAEKAEALANFFSKVLINEPDDQFQELWENPVPTIVNSFQITEEKIKKKLQNIKTNKSPGPDDIFPKILKEAAHEISYPLSIIFNSSLNSGTVPTPWKLGKISAIHKKGSKKKCENYRPISLTSVVCKIMESLVRDHIMDYMLENKYFTNRQYGFLPGRSTIIQLINILDIWTEALDQGKHIEVVYMDIQKAFDTVPHRRLLHKLQMYGIQGQIYTWIQDFLSNRQQYVCINEVPSEKTPVTSGVPQGSVLGPVLFVIYINDLPSKLKSDAFMFADDTKIFHIYDDKLIEDIQEDLDKLQNWSDQWLLKFHPDKCKQLHIKKTSLTTVLPTRHLYKSQGEQIQEVELESITTEKDLGITFDNCLNFKHHINNIIKKASQMMGIIRRTFENLSPEIFKPLYIALVRSGLEYGQTVWSPFLIGDIRRVEQVQRNATKKINGFKNLTYKERLEKLGLPTLVYRRKRGDMIELYKILHDIYDEQVKPHLPLAQDVRRGHQYKLFKKRTLRLDIRKYSFTNRVVDTWNSLPSYVVDANSLNSFKNRLDKHWKNDPTKYEFN